MKLRFDSYAWLLLIAPGTALFIYLVTWSNCIPISKLDQYSGLANAEVVPDGSTCFLTNHGTAISYYRFPDPQEEFAVFYSLIALMAIMTLLMIAPGLRLFLKWRRIVKR